MRSGPAFDCKSVRNAQNPSSEPPTAFPRMLTPERLVCIAEALWAFCLSANPATRRSPVSRVLSLSLPPSLPSARPPVRPPVPFTGESGPQGRRFRCCPRSPWPSSAERRRPFWQPAGACGPPVSASPPTPRKTWTMSPRSSRGSAKVGPYRASLTPKGLPSPPPAAAREGGMKQTRVER